MGEKFGNALRSLRKEKNLTLKELASKLNIRLTAISRWELNQTEPDLNMLEKLADFFNVSVDYLMGRENYDYTKKYPEK